MMMMMMIMIIIIIIITATFQTFRRYFNNTAVQHEQVKKRTIRSKYMCNLSQYTAPLRVPVSYLYCYTVHLVDSLIITQPTNALIVCHLFLNHFFKNTFTVSVHDASY